jgi:hypothetical protein
VHCCSCSSPGGADSLARLTICGYPSSTYDHRSNTTGFYTRLLLSLSSESDIPHAQQICIPETQSVTMQRRMVSTTQNFALFVELR